MELSNVGAFLSGVSADGRVIVGQARNVFSYASDRAFLWTADTGPVDLGVFPGQAANAQSAAHGVSVDGSVVVGSALFFHGIGDLGGFRWTQTSGMTHLAGGGATGAYAISADGLVIAGVARDPASTVFRPVRWLAEGMVMASRRRRRFSARCSWDF